MAVPVYREIGNAIRHKLPMVLGMCVFIAIFYFIYEYVLSPTRIICNSPNHHIHPIAPVNDLRAPPGEAMEGFGTTYSACIEKGYDTHFCLRSENQYTRSENIPEEFN
jgi:hypothetical protein